MLYGRLVHVGETFNRSELHKNAFGGWAGDGVGVWVCGLGFDVTRPTHGTGHGVMARLAAVRVRNGVGVWVCGLGFDVAWPTALRYRHVVRTCVAETKRQRSIEDTGSYKAQSLNVRYMFMTKSK